MDDGIICEEYVEDAPFVGHRCDYLAPSFCIGRDVYVGYFIAVHFVDGNFEPILGCSSGYKPKPRSW